MITGSQTAKNGLLYEELFANAISDHLSPISLKILCSVGIDVSNVLRIESNVLRTRYKTDVVMKVIFIDETSVINKFSIKKTKNKSDFNQLDRRGVEKYKQKFIIFDDEYRLLRYFTGDAPYSEYFKDPEKKGRSLKRMFFNEFTEIDQRQILACLDRIKLELFRLAFKGDKPEHVPDYMITIFTQGDEFILNEEMIHITPIDDAIRIYYDDGAVSITKKGNIKIGKLTLQRKGGDSGKDTANDLQIKIKPSILLLKSL